MDDLDDVRAALGYDQINLYGESYGPTAAQVYLLRHGEHVRAAAFGNASLLDVPMFERYPANSQRALDQLFDCCRQDPVCSAAYPNLEDEFNALNARLSQTPVELPVVDPRTGQPLLYTHELMATGVHSLLFATEKAVLLPALIHMAYQDDWSAIIATVGSGLQELATPPPWQVMKLTILCHEPWARLRASELAKAGKNSYLTPADVRALLIPEEICAVVPRPEKAALYTLKNGKIPAAILWINGEADPQDPPANVAGVTKRFPNSILLTAPDQGHGYTGASCRAAIISEFFAHGSGEDLSTGCLNEVMLPAFAQ
jgi:pimeloyl-ACP methyl ester carboxylesterase